MVGQTLKQVQGDSYLLFAILLSVFMMLQPQARQALEGHVKKNCLPAIFFTKFSSENLHTLYANKRRALLGARSLTNPGSATHGACWFAGRNGGSKSKCRKNKKIIKKATIRREPDCGTGKKLVLLFRQRKLFFLQVLYAVKRNSCKDDKSLEYKLQVGVYSKEGKAVG